MNEMIIGGRRTHVVSPKRVEQIKEEKWFTSHFEECLMKKEADNYWLIQMPCDSGYDDYVFWHPKKLVRKNPYGYTISFNQSFLFDLSRYKEDKNSFFHLTDGCTLSAEEMEEAHEAHIAATLN